MEEKETSRLKQCSNLVGTLNGKLNSPCEEKMQRRKDYLKLRPIWRCEDGNRKVRKLPFMRLIENANLNNKQLQKKANLDMQKLSQTSLEPLVQNYPGFLPFQCAIRKRPYTQRKESGKFFLLIHHHSKEELF